VQSYRNVSAWISANVTKPSKWIVLAQEQILGTLGAVSFGGEPDLVIWDGHSDEVTVPCEVVEFKSGHKATGVHIYNDWVLGGYAGALPDLPLARDIIQTTMIN
jgi:hypothetical protein